MREDLFERPCWVLDILPDRVPEGSPGQFFAVEEYFLRPPLLAELHRRFADILLRLNCYYDFLVSPADGTEPEIINPPPEYLVSHIAGEPKDMCILLPGEDALITVNHDDLYMTVYHPGEALRRRLELLAAGTGLFLRRGRE